MPLIKVGQGVGDDDGAQGSGTGPGDGVDIGATNTLGGLGLYPIKFGVEDRSV